MKALKYILFLLLIVIIGLAIYIAVQPNSFSFSRSRIINAPKSLLFNKINDFKSWPSFSPWIEHEPEAKLTYGDTTSGVNASYAWNGNILGEGGMKTLSVEQNKSINQKIFFIKPFESESDINWTFENTNEGTKVTWAMSGKQDFMTKMYTTFAGSIEENTSPDFDRGLFKLDSIVTAEMKKFTIKIDGISEYGGGFYMYKTTSATKENISKIIGKQFGEIMSYMAQNNIVASGMPFTIYNDMNPENGGIIMSNAIPVLNKVTPTGDGQILCGYIPKTKVVKTTLKGNYTNLPKAWEQTMQYLAKNNLEQAAIPPFEIYTNDPGDFPNPANWITEIYIPIK
ncbi:GyrI-like domain-containing protein [Tamlana sp. 62-3]|uniref:GyrI-like domain-containing protein n=1 Tax=Neotamlana sargassicola TaxID=2883125 RepID=A0A9X1L823_9FLAO|nr:GyrI-like domain-containing protein [Tamlana sargassicola]MCB4809436.1 GyrI-like domain-containing protein [Tamlana sargassicola]